MNGLSKIVLFALFLIFIVLLLSSYHQHGKRTYSKRIQQQLKAIYIDLQQHMENAILLCNTQPLAAFQQTCFSASEIDALKRIAPEEDLDILIGSNLDTESAQVQALQKKLWNRLRSNCFRTLGAS